MLLLLIVALLAMWVTPSGCMRGPHHPRGHYHHQPHTDTKLTQDSELLRDVNHIIEDLEGYGLSSEALNQLTPEELDFHFFKLHDFDNNTKLDGLEILQAIQHTVHAAEEELWRHSGHESEGSGGHSSDLKLISFEDKLPYFVALIDQVLAEDDKDNDGYLSYMEYVIGRQKEPSKEELLKQTLHSHGEN